MVQGYYTLDEAARILGMDAERLNQMAQRREIRAFADRGTWRFRTQDIEEMARRLGMGSNPDLQLGEVEKPKPASSAKPRSGAKAQGDEGIFDFSGPSQRDPSEIDHEIVIESPTGQKSGRRSGAISPSPKPGSDSDVHLVFDVGGDLPIGSDSDVKLEDSGPHAPRSGPQRKSGPMPEGPKSTPRKKPQLPGSRAMDSGVRLVPMEDDNSLPLGQQPPFSSGTDSDIRLAPDKGRSMPSDDQLAQTTEDINLDEELRRAEELAQGRKPRSKVKRKTDVKLQQHTPATGGDPAATEFELPKPKSGPRRPGSGVKGPGSGAKPGSKVRKDDTVNLRLDQVEEAELGLGGLDEPAEISGSTKVSGINLSAPADSGINLEEVKEPSSDSVEFELSLDSESTPKPVQEAPEVDSSGEFELTLDEEGGAAAGDEDPATVHEKGGEKDIFETDFEAPAIGESKEGVALDESDTDLESSDFDLSLGDEDSGSQVVALEEEEADEGAATVAHQARAGRAAAGEEEATDEIDELLAEDEVEELPAEEEEEDFRPRRAVAAAPAEWGALPAIVMIPSVVITLLVCLMSFELLHTMWGYQHSNRPSAWLVKTFAGLIGEKVD
jgi:excisionase family DNA binding protein